MQRWWPCKTVTHSDRWWGGGGLPLNYLDNGVLITTVYVLWVGLEMYFSFSQASSFVVSRLFQSSCLCRRVGGLIDVCDHRPNAHYPSTFIGKFGRSVRGCKTLKLVFINKVASRLHTYSFLATPSVCGHWVGKSTNHLCCLLCLDTKLKPTYIMYLRGERERSLITLKHIKIMQTNAFKSLKSFYFI